MRGIYICGCCGKRNIKGKQWFNADKGYGLCGECFHGFHEEHNLYEAVTSYGRPGIHYDIEPTMHYWYSDKLRPKHTIPQELIDICNAFNTNLNKENLDSRLETLGQSLDSYLAQV